MFEPTFILLCFGVVTIFLGMRFQKQGLNTYGQRYGERMKQRWLKWLVGWGVVMDTDQANLVLPDVVDCDVTTMSAAMIGGGIGLLISTLGYLLLITAVPQITLLQDSTPWFYIVPESTLLAIGYIVGYSIGIQRQRLAAQRRGTYADLRPRTLEDYRYPFLPALSGLLIIVSLSFTGMVAQHAWSTFSVQDILGTVTTLHSVFWPLWVMPAGMIALLLVCEVAVRQVVKLPRLFATTDPLLSQRIDELLRARAVGKFQSIELFGIAAVSFGQWLLLRYEAWSIAPWGTYAALLLIIGIGVFGLFLGDFAGRLGGKITGWPWRKKVLA